MSDLSRFLDYARAFEVAFLTGDFEVIAPFFADDAVHLVASGEPFSHDDRGRDAVVAGLARSVDHLDRRFDARIAEVMEGPTPREDGIWMRWGLRFRRAGLPDLRVAGEHLTAYDAEGHIARIDEKILDDGDARTRAYLEQHDAALKPAGSPFAAPGADDLAVVEAATRRTLVRAYGAAKSAQDVDGALAVCHPDFTVDTVPFGLETRDREDTRAQLGVFFAVFPDYAALTEEIADGDDAVAWWGRARMTFAGDFLGVKATGRTAELPAASIFQFRDGLIVRERFLFDLAALCEAIDVPIATFGDTLRTLRDA